MATELLLIRHGELPETFAHRYVGRTDPGLSEAGKAACAYLQELQCDLVCCSPSRRARETAAWITAPLEVDARLMEIDFGKWENLTFDEIASRADPALLQLWAEAPEQMLFPDGESVAAFQHRVDDFFAEITTRPEERIAVVTHGGCLMRILAQLRHLPVSRQFECLPARGTMVQLYHHQGKWHEQ